VKRFLITGANGFIGGALYRRLDTTNKVIGIDLAKPTDGGLDIAWVQADLTDEGAVDAICEKHSPDVVIHCAGIAHQKMGAIDSAEYMRVNSEATENLAKNASRANPDVSFIFLSSISVYGEGPQITQNKKDVSRKGEKAQRGKKYPQISQSKRTITNSDDGVGEDGEYWPSSDYAVSKLDAERRLGALFDAGKLKNLIILRLAPVYDREWSSNLDRRVFAPSKVAYLRFGSGMQRMSALARPNLVEFIEFLVNSKLATDAHRRTGRKKDKNNLGNRCNLRMNVCDAEPYEFNRIIEVFKKSGIHPNRPVISVPLSPVWVGTRVAGAFFHDKKGWFHSCYDKLASDLVFDNKRMLGTGFVPRHSLETIFFSGAKNTGLATDAHRLTQTSTD
jgi:nucleoside-diphosphate-sugar epimerase